MAEKTTEKQMSVFETLYKVNVNEWVEKKGNLSYVSWANAWAAVKKLYPDANYTVYERDPDNRGNPINYFTDGKTCWVKTGMTIGGIEHIEMLPVMDFSNRSIPLEKVTANDVNKAIQRSLTKAAARHGLGLYIYAGEDLPEEEANAKKQEEAKKPKEEPVIEGFDNNGPIMGRKPAKATVETVPGVPGW